MIAFLNASQGYDTLLAEVNEKLWKQKTEQFMKRTKSESLVNIHERKTPLCLLCLVETLDFFLLIPSF